MTRQSIYVSDYDWFVVVFYDSEYKDADRILGEMDSIGVDEYTYIKAKNNLRGGRKDTGLTYTNERARTSVIVLSKTTSKAEFANTWFHELIHCAMHIAKANGLSPYGEPIAYVGGELSRKMQPIAARLMCPTCKD